MCAIDSLMARINKEHDELDKEALADLIKSKKRIIELEKKVSRLNIERAKLSIQAIAL